MAEAETRDQDDAGTREGQAPDAATTSPTTLTAAADPAAGRNAAGAGLNTAGDAERPGDLQTRHSSPMPADLEAQLNRRERRTAAAMIAGKSYQDALTAAGVPPNSRLRDQRPPDHVQAAVDATIREIAYFCGVDRKWILTNTVALYRRATAAEPVLDRQGRETGEYRFDGATAARCLDLLGRAEGVFRPADKGGRGIAAGDVAALLEAVQARGRGTVDASRPRTLDHDAPAQAAPQQADASPSRMRLPDGSSA